MVLSTMLSSLIEVLSTMVNSLIADCSVIFYGAYSPPVGLSGAFLCGASTGGNPDVIRTVTHMIVKLEEGYLVI